jgi:UDP-N-acetylmuramyl pentapeptide phosphotransferase/UDP-N-acetylglucosamine-1-phosphate transferase
VAVACFVAALGACGVSLALVRMGQRHRHALDETGSGPQKIHETPVPRVGGVAIAIGMLAAMAVVSVVRGDASHSWLLLLCASPGFAWGLLEDVSKRGAVFARLAITSCSAMLGFVLLDARITELGIPGVDAILTVPALSFAFTVFAVAGVGHSMNVIDGLNGLSSVIAIFASLGLAIIAWIIGDHFVAFTAIYLACAVAGFLVVNYPRGRIFLGDGGAYLIGLLLATLSVLLVQRNPAVSPWFPLLLLAYPIWETLFSMYRRRARRVSAGTADALHLHSLVYRRVVRAKVCKGAGQHCWARNSLASLLLWTLPALCWVPAVAFWNRTHVLQLAAIVFAVIYVLIYRRIVRFRVPTWLVLRSGPQAEAMLSSIATEGK